MAGFFGAISIYPCVTDVFYGTDYLSHLGTRRGGMATYDETTGHFNRSIHSISKASFRSKMEEELPKFIGNAGIGIISDTDAQPLLFNSRHGRFALITIGKINNFEELAKQALEHNMHLSEFSSGKVNPTELVGLMIIQKPSLEEGIRYAQEQIKGSLSLMLLTENGVVCARDLWGRTPVVIGQKEGAFCAASEPSAFYNLGYTLVHNLGPGEIVRLYDNRMEKLAEPLPDHMQICSFLWVYYGFPTSVFEGRNVEDVRNNIGFEMGKEDDMQVDCCCGVPDSGIGMAIGYSEGHNVPYRRAVTKYTTTWARSFMPSSQNMRNLVAKMKLIQNNTIIQNRRVLLCDDSIVRGTQLRDNTRCLLEGGAKEIHMRIASPPLVYACPFINFSESKSVMELITRRVIAELEGEEAAMNEERVHAYTITDSPEYKRMVDCIAEKFGLHSLRFTKLETLIRAIGLPHNHVCTHCFDGSSSHTL
ncbi:MAG: amidophosphoribosyltransferase [Bacteroidaceae bacterium]|nr:amidophosphoribosyltransferase [Bacteroidaceae bacterium]MBP3786487.1 amidophosphoribosyltransferase [Bacteroidaceae bacterium]